MHHITYDKKNSVQLWLFPHQISQSTINGRHGSTACTLIALLMAYKYHVKKTLLNIQTQLSPAWFNLIVSSILEGNTVHDNAFNHMPVTLQLPMASRLLMGTIGQINLGQELPVNFSTENNSPHTSNLEHYLNNMVQNTCTSASSPSAIIVTFRGNTFTFVHDGQSNILFLDSHLHEPHGACVASVPVSRVSELLRWIRLDYLGTNFNFCSCTAIYF